MCCHCGSGDLLGFASRLLIEMAHFCAFGCHGSISNSRFIVAWGNSYECSFRLSGTPVALRVSGPIFIEDGETVRVVGRDNWNGVFDASAYYNRSSGASGNSDQALAQRLFDKWIATICGLGMMLAVVGPITSSLFIRGGHLVADLLFVVFGFFGLPIILVGWRMFVRYRSETRTIASLLNDCELTVRRYDHGH
jgi:hypothetical protein